MTALALAFEQTGLVPASERLKALLLDACRLSKAEWAEAAGWTDPEADRNQRRLMQVAKEALKAAPRNWDGAKDAFYKSVRNDAALLWELFAPYRSQAVQILLSHAAAELRDLERAQRAASEPSAPGHSRYGDQQALARRANSNSGMGAVAAVARLSLLDTFKVNGQSIGDLTASEARKWAISQRRNARFVELLTANLPPNEPIRKFRTGDDTQAIYEQASQEAIDAG